MKNQKVIIGIGGNINTEDGIHRKNPIFVQYHHIDQEGQYWK